MSTRKQPLTPPAPSTGHLPVITKQQLLPFGELQWENFERLCLQLASSDGNPERCQRYGSPGQNQDGINILVRLRSGNYTVWQVKRHQAFSVAKIRTAVEKFLKGKWRHNTDRFILAVQASLQYFIEQMKKSRLGLYQEILSSKKITKFRELITGNTIDTFRSVKVYEKGEIFLTRLVEYKGQIYQFGDPKCWPKEYKSQIEGFAREKLLYFDGINIEEKYMKLMKLGGPYWMSCVTSNPNFPILAPDHYLEYLRDQ